MLQFAPEVRGAPERGGVYPSPYPCTGLPIQVVSFRFLSVSEASGSSLGRPGRCFGALRRLRGVFGRLCGIFGRSLGDFEGSLGAFGEVFGPLWVVPGPPLVAFGGSWGCLGGVFGPSWAPGPKKVSRDRINWPDWGGILVHS